MIQYKGGNGTTKQEAVMILGAENEMEGVEAEYNWLEKKYGEENVEWEINLQELVDEGNKQYDILRIKLLNSEIKEVWFEITEFYGRE